MTANKYYNIYNSIIERAKSREKLLGYTERHHIVPRSLGGSDEQDNLVELTAREHFIVHMCLARFTTGKDRKAMITAARYMAVVADKNPNQQRYTSRLYEIAKQDYVENVLKGHPVWYSEKNWSEETNRKRSETMKKRIAENGGPLGMQKGSKHTEETRALLRKRKAETTYVFTEEHKAKMAEANRINGLKKRGKSLPKTECCGRMWDPGNLAKHRKSGKCQRV